MNYREANKAAPATPACFSDREAWVGYLMTSTGCRKVSPFVDGVYRTEFNFCDDCTLEHASLMNHVGKCNPSIFRVIPIKTVVLA